MALKFLIGLCALFLFLYRWRTSAALLTQLVGKQRLQWLSRVVIGFIGIYLIFSLVNTIRY